MTWNSVFRTARNVVVVAAIAGATAACGGGGGGGGSVSHAATPFEDDFGLGFGADFRASANTTPVVPSASDLVPLTLTAQPLQFPSS